MSDIKKIAEIMHEKGLPLIVDEAHGAHLTGAYMALSDRAAENGDTEDGDEEKREIKFPLPAMMCGADLVVESLHKMLPALTQTGVLHLCSDWVDRELVERYLAIYETSSPSYVLMASAAQCVDWLVKEGEEAFLLYQNNLKKIYKKSKKWDVLFLWENKRKEPSKLVVGIRDGVCSGTELADILRKKYRIETELAAAGYVLAMTSPCDTDEGLERFLKALGEIDVQLQEKVKEKTIPKESAADKSIGQKELHQTAAVSAEQYDGGHPIVCTGIYEAMNAEREKVSLTDCAGRIAAEYIMVYPPGIPFIVPGEKITEEITKKIRLARDLGLQLVGTDGERVVVMRELI